RRLRGSRVLPGVRATGVAPPTAPRGPGRRRHGASGTATWDTSFPGPAGAYGPLPTRRRGTGGVTGACRPRSVKSNQGESGLARSVGLAAEFLHVLPEPSPRPGLLGRQFRQGRLVADAGKIGVCQPVLYHQWGLGTGFGAASGDLLSPGPKFGVEPGQ